MVNFPQLKIKVISPLTNYYKTIEVEAPKLFQKECDLVRESILDTLEGCNLEDSDSDVELENPNGVIIVCSSDQLIAKRMGYLRWFWHALWYNVHQYIRSYHDDNMSKVTRMFEEYDGSEDMNGKAFM